MKFILRVFLFVGTIAGISLLESSMAHTQQRMPSAADKLEAVRARKEALYSAIASMNKNKTCDGDGQCEALETGARLCGGPGAYTIVSNANPAYSSLKAKIAETVAVEKEWNLLQTPGDCAPVPKLPEARCIKQECTAVTGK